MSYIIYLANNLLIIYSRISFFPKMKAAVKVAFCLSIPSWLISNVVNWSLSNRNYIAGVLVCIAIDHLIGSIFHAFKLKDFTFRKNIEGLLYKLGLCACAAVLFEIIHSTLRDVPLIYEYLKTTTRLIIVLYPASSAFLNMSALTNGAFPPLGWIKRITTFNKTLDLNKIYKSGSYNTTEDTTASS